MLWERFLKTGKIADYLRYRRSSEVVEDDNTKRSDNKGGSQRREQ